MELEFFCKPDTDLECLNTARLLPQVSHGPGHAGKTCACGPRERGAELLQQGHHGHRIPLPFGWASYGHRRPNQLRSGPHQEASGKSLEYFDADTSEHYIPFVWSRLWAPSGWPCAFGGSLRRGAARRGDSRVVLHLHPSWRLTRPRSCRFPRSWGIGPGDLRPSCPEFMRITTKPAPSASVYRRQDEVGTPYCVTVDSTPRRTAASPCGPGHYGSVRIPVAELKSYLTEHTRYKKATPFSSNPLALLAGLLTEPLRRIGCIFRPACRLFDKNPLRGAVRRSVGLFTERRGNKKIRIKSRP
jgi:glycyl-tRNA synthetase